MQVLVIEDDASIAGVVRQGLSELGHDVDVAHDGGEGERFAREGDYDAIVLDLLLPGRSGIDVCRDLRRDGVTAPILMLTALSSTGDKVAGLEAGADDYLVKPFELEELVARLRALHRRVRGAEGSELRYDDLEISLLKRQVTRAGRRIRLTAREFSLLEYFMRHADRVLTRSAIGQAVWGTDLQYGGNVIEVYVSALRRKIDRGFARPLIHTLIGVGYRFGREDAE